jgi:hypothetical protein
MRAARADAAGAGIWNGKLPAAVLQPLRERLN